MRITNKMMTNNMLHNINVNKNNMSTLEGKYSSGMEIQKPSDDPIVAVRALKLRTNLSELNQYYNKNIPDAMSWMEVTESALKNTSEIITQIHTYCTQGANDTLTVDERNSIVQNLQELKNQIYQEGNSNYAGRYLFTGYKTNTSLVFENRETNLEYKITEKVEASQIDISNRIKDSTIDSELEKSNIVAYNNSIQSGAEARPTSQTVYRIRLAYDKLEDKDITIKVGGSTIVPERLTSGETDPTKPEPYNPAPGTINYLTDTGEIIMSEDVYNTYRNSDFEIDYYKDTFEKNELRPEHYFDCTSTNKSNGEAVTYTKEEQEITYEVNFNQRIAINVQAKDAFRPSLGRAIDDIVKAISDVDAVKEKIKKVDKLLEDPLIGEAEKKAATEMKGVLNSELSLKDSLMRKAYEKCLTAMDSEEDVVNSATSSIGTRYNRLELTQDRLSTQQVEFTDLLSQNEDADLVDTIVNYNAANTVYNASLQAAGKVVKNTLLDFI